MSSRVLKVVFLIGSLAWGSQAFSATTCSVNSSGVAFGVYNPLTPTPLDSTGTVAVTCTLTFPPFVDNVNYTIDLSAGSSGSMTGRHMQAFPNLLYYNLFTTTARNIVWGDDTGGTSDITGSMRLGFFFLPSTRTNTHTIFGRIPAGQDIPPGSYSDTIVVTVTY